MKKSLKKVYILLSKTIMGIFYDKKFLTGKYFDDNVKGWHWCWRSIFMQKILGYNRSFPFPVSFRSEFGNWKNIKFNIDDLNNFQHFGCYFQSWKGKITIGKGTYIAPNVGIITSNHDIEDLEKHQNAEDVIIGEKSWIGMNSVILPGTILGPNTIVGAGSVVTKSFPEGKCIIAGTPAQLIKKIK